MSARRRQVPAWPRGPERPDRDPERLRPAPPHPGFAQFPLDVDTDVCRLCRALVPATELARARHQDWDAQVVMAATVALTNQLSGAGERPSEIRTSEVRHDPAPDHTSPPTPEQEASTAAGRSGVEGANQPKPGASEAPHSPDATQPSAGSATSLSRPAGGANVPAGADPEVIDLADYERRLAREDGTR